MGLGILIWGRRRARAARVDRPERHEDESIVRANYSTRTSDAVLALRREIGVE